MVADQLATHRRCFQRVRAEWPGFLQRRSERLEQQRRYGVAPEKAAEDILEDLFTHVLDWSLSELNSQVGYADLVLTRLGIKHLIVEVKRPGALAWQGAAVDRAVAQARGYAEQQKVHSVAVSDGVLLYACDLTVGGSHDRLLARLDQTAPPEDLWWISVDGIYRPRLDAAGRPPDLLARPLATPLDHETDRDLHPHYHLPASCFGYVGRLDDPHTWHLPYLLADGSPDPSRLPKAIQCIFSNYRGAHVASVPEVAIPDVLVSLGRAARVAGKLPCPGRGASIAYVKLEQALEQLGRLEEVLASV